MSLKTVSDGIITADDGAGQGDVIIRYSFDKDGLIYISCDNQSFFNNQPWVETNP
jgi:hypothetical protein